MTPLNHAQVLIAGEALMDLISEPNQRFHAVSGGAAFNVTRALGLQQVSAAYLNPLSKDAFGRRLAQELRDAQVTLARPEAVDGSTSLAVVNLDPNGQASYAFYRQGVADRDVTASELMAASDMAERAQMVVTGCLALMPEDARAYQPWLQAQRRKGRLVVIDANMRPSVAHDSETYRHTVLMAMQHAHLIKVSDEDLHGMTPNAMNTAPLAQAQALFEQTPAEAIWLTLGAQGAIWLDRSGSAWHGHTPSPLTVQDTVGAGDCFLAGALTELLKHPKLVQQLLHVGAKEAHEFDAAKRAVLQHGVASASWCVQHTGCTPPTPQDLKQQLQQHPVHIRALESSLQSPSPVTSMRSNL